MSSPYPISTPSAYDMLAPTFRAHLGRIIPVLVSKRTHTVAIVMLRDDVTSDELDLACVVHFNLGRGLLALA